MTKKYCPRCRKFSYSASAAGSWLCPVCGHDLHKRPVYCLDNGDINEGYAAAPLALIYGGLMSKG